MMLRCARNHKKYIGVLGDSMLDVYQHGILIQKKGATVFQKAGVECVPGGAGNVTRNIRQMEEPPLLFSVVGKDPATSKYLACLEQYGIHATGLSLDPNSRISVKTRLVTKGKAILRIDSTARHHIGGDGQSRLQKRLCRYLPQCAVLIVSDYQEGCISPALYAQTYALCAEHNVKMMVDSLRRFTLEDVFLYKPNLYEFEQRVGRTLSEFSEIQQQAVSFKQTHRIENMILTMDTRGLLFVDDTNRCRHLAAAVETAVDPCGAGDAMIAAVAVLLYRDVPLLQAVRLANVACAICCSNQGTYAVSMREIGGWIREGKPYPDFIEC